MRYAILFLIAMVLLFSTGCYYDSEEVLYPNTFCDTVNVTYSGTIEPIIDANCATAACHAPGGDGTGDFTTYAGVLESVRSDFFLPSIRREPTAIPMPLLPSDPLRPCEVRQIELWIEADTLNN